MNNPGKRVPADNGITGSVCQLKFFVSLLRLVAFGLKVREQISELLIGQWVQQLFGHQRDGRFLKLIQIFSIEHRPFVFGVEQRDCLGVRFSRYAPCALSERFGFPHTQFHQGLVPLQPVTDVPERLLPLSSF